MTTNAVAYIHNPRFTEDANHRMAWAREMWRVLVTAPVLPHLVQGNGVTKPLRLTGIDLSGWSWLVFAWAVWRWRNIYGWRLEMLRQLNSFTWRWPL